MARRFTWAALLNRVDWVEVRAILGRMHAARANPEDPKSEPWLAIGELTPRQIATFYRHIPNPLAKRGRRRGSRTTVDGELVEALNRMVENGEHPTTAARLLWQERGVRFGLKGRADHLVRVWKESRE
jgi:hypothetical protein